MAGDAIAAQGWRYVPYQRTYHGLPVVGGANSVFYGYLLEPDNAKSGGFHQRSDSTELTRSGLPIATDADQNRVFFGVQFGYPIRFD